MQWSAPEDRMIRIAALALLGQLLTPSAWAGDNPCRGFKVKQDEFTGTTSIKALAQHATEKLIGIELSLQNAVAELRLTAKFTGAVDGVMPIGTPVSLKFEDGQVATWATTSEAVLVADADSVNVYTRVPYVIALDDAKLSQLAGQRVSDIRTRTLTGQDRDWKSEKWVYGVLLRAAECVKSHVGA
jgi:hypothetical protein